MLGLRFCARAFSSCGKWGPLFIAVRGPLTITASLAAEHRLQKCRLSSCGSRAQLLCGMWDLLRPGLEPVSPALAGRFSTTVPPGKPTFLLFSTRCYRFSLPQSWNRPFLQGVLFSFRGDWYLEASLFTAIGYHCLSPLIGQNKGIYNIYINYTPIYIIHTHIFPLIHLRLSIYLWMTNHQFTQIPLLPVQQYRVIFTFPLHFFWLHHVACGILVPWPGWNPCPLHWQADS